MRLARASRSTGAVSVIVFAMINLGTAVIALMLRSYAPAGKAQTAATAPEPADLVPLRAE